MTHRTESPLGLVPFSRRTFFSLTAAVGALSFVGSVLGPTRYIQAWADEEDHLSFVVYLLGREEVPIMAYDITDAENPQPIGGVKVTVTSHCVKGSDGTKTVTTDKTTGFAAMDIRKMSWQADSDSSDVYNFWGRIEAQLDGYRRYATEMCFVESGTPQKVDDKGHAVTVNELRVPMQKISDADQPYLRQLTLDGFDIQYTQNAPARVCSENTAQHEIAAEVIAPKSGLQMEVSLYADDSLLQTVDATVDQERPKSHTATFTGTWLDGGKFKVGGRLSVAFGEKGSATRVVCKSPVEFAEAVLLSPGVKGTYKDISLSPGYEPQNETEDITQYAKKVIPPLFGGASDAFQCAFPFTPLRVFLDGSGNFGATLVMGRFNWLRSKTGSELSTKSQIEFYTGNGNYNGWGNYWARWDYKKSEYLVSRSLMKDLDLKACRFPMSTTLSLNVMFDLGVIGSALKDTRDDAVHLNLDFMAGGQFCAALGWTWPFMAGPVPLYVALDLALVFNAHVYARLVTDDYFTRYTWNKSALLNKEAKPNSVVVLFNFEIAAEAGVGLRGFLSMSVRGYAYAVVTCSFDDAREVAKEKGVTAPAWPHLTTTLGGDVQVVVQIFFVKKTFNIFSKLFPGKTFTAWDNRNKDAIDALTGVGNAEDIDEYEFSEFDVVLDTDLASLVKVTGRWETTREDAIDSGEILAPTYDALPTEIDGKTVPLPSAFDLMNDETDARSPINGIVPDNQIVLYKGSYMNPRLRIVHTDTSSFKHDRAFMVRIETAQVPVPPSANGEPNWVVKEVDGNYFFAPETEVKHPVNVDGVPRTRVVVAEWDNTKRHWGKAYTIDFSVNGELESAVRANSHDVDFDANLHNGKLLIAISSMVRPESPSGFEDFEACQYLSVVNYDIDTHEVVAAGTTYSVLASDTGLFSPHILMQDYDDGNKTACCCVVYSYLCKYNAKRKRASGGIAVTVFDGMDKKKGFSNHRIVPPTLIIDNAYITSKGLYFKNFIKGTFEVSLPDRGLTVRDSDIDRDKSVALIAWSCPRSKSSEDDLSFVFADSFNVVVESKSGATSYEPHVSEHDCLTLPNVKCVSRFGDAKQRAVFGYSDINDTENKKPLKVVKFDAKDLKLSVTDSLGDSEKTTFFTSFNGRRLYCVRCMDGQAPGVSADIAKTAAKEGTRVVAGSGAYSSPTSEVSTEAKKVSLYQLLEARYLDDVKSYTNFYPIAQIDRIPDNIGVIAVNDFYTHFTMATITSYEKNTCDICQVDVPLQMQALPSSVSPASPYTAPGYTCYYQCEIANTGNVPITSLTMEVSVSGTKITNTFDDLSKVMQDSPDDIKTACNDEGDPLTNDDGTPKVVVSPSAITKAGVFLPGTRRLFNLSFVVPKDLGLHGTTSFDVKLVGYANNLKDDVAFGSLTSRAKTDNFEEDILPLFAEDYCLDPIDGLKILESFYETPLELGLNIDSDAYMQQVDLAPANYTTLNTGTDNPGGSGTSATSGGSGGTTTNGAKGESSSSTTPKTGEDLAGVAALVAAAAVAGKAAYDGLKRREPKEGEDA